MATIQTDTDTCTVPDESPIREACEALGVPFGCRSGFCTTCRIEIIEGAENLAPPNVQERTHGFPPNERLACQTVIKKGTVKIRF